MQGRTYRFLDKEPEFPFGFGLSYTRFAYALDGMPASAAAGEALTFRGTVTNVGDRASDAVLQVYLTDEAASVRVPVRQLVWFARVDALAPGETRTVQVTIPARAMAVVCEDGSCQIVLLKTSYPIPDALEARAKALPGGVHVGRHARFD